MGFPGGKAGAGTFQKIINQIPPHEIYCEAFLGDGAIMRRKRPALRNIAVEIDPSTAAAFSGPSCSRRIKRRFKGTQFRRFEQCG